MSYTKHKTIRWSVNQKNDCSIQISLICLAKDEEMRSKIEVEKIRPGRKLKNS